MAALAPAIGRNTSDQWTFSRPSRRSTPFVTGSTAFHRNGYKRCRLGRAVMVADAVVDRMPQ